MWIYRFIALLRGYDVEGVNYYDIFRRVAVDLRISHEAEEEQNVEIRECLGQKFFFRPHHLLVELLEGVCSHIQTEQQLRDYFTDNPDALRGLELKLNERGWHL